MPSKGTTGQRGYGAQHQARREYWKPIVAAGNVDCRRCGKPIHPSAAWDLGHDDEDRSLPTYPEHRHARDCEQGGNRATAGRQTPAPALGFFD